MNEAEFDKFADEYHSMHVASITASGEGPEFFAAYKIADLAFEQAQKRTAQSQPPSILDFGSGSGSSIPYMLARFPGSELTCLDVSKRSLELAASRFSSQASFVSFDGTTLPFPDASFDIVFAACVFHHIDHDSHLGLLREWQRVLRPGGMALVYEHNPNNPMTRRVVDSCPFDENAHLINGSAMRDRMLKAGFSDAAVRFRVFFPRLLRALRPIERGLSWLPLGAQYYVVARRS